MVSKLGLVTMFLTMAMVALGAGRGETACTEIYNPDNGWIIDLCDSDPQVPITMQVVLDGIDQGRAVMVRVYHETGDRSSTPQVAVLYASGFIRLKQNADPQPAIPFGSSFVLGPAYWSDEATYHHSPQLTRLEITTSRLPSGPLLMHAEGSNSDFEVGYDLALPPARDDMTRLHVVQTYSALVPIAIPASRIAEHQGLKLVQVSSMYSSEGGSCDGGFSDCHDSDGLRYIAADLARREVAYASPGGWCQTPRLPFGEVSGSLARHAAEAVALPYFEAAQRSQRTGEPARGGAESDTSHLAPSCFVLESPQPLGSTWLDAIHSDDASWQGNTPNVRIALDELPSGGTITPQGWLTASSNPNDDNLGLWLHDDAPDSHSWNAGDSGRVGYWLLATDDPPDPWDDHGLRSGTTFLDMQGGETCVFVRDAGQATSGAVVPIDGYSDRALELRYDLGSDNGSWTQLRCDFDPPLDLSAYDHLRFEWRGDGAAASSLEVALISRVSGDQRIFGRDFHHASHRGWWGQMVVPFSFLGPWTPGTVLDPSQITAFFVSVVKDPVADTGGAGSIAIDNVGAFNVAERQVPVRDEQAAANPAAADAAVSWLLSQQQAGGLLKSWQEEETCIAHTYDQALALLVLSHAGEWSAADSIVAALATTQNPNGSWYKSRNCLTLEVVGDEEWEGDIAWAVLALNRYLEWGGTSDQAATIRSSAANWLVGRIDPSGCLVIDHTEGTIDVWWALATSGPAYADAADGIRSCLLDEYWDDTMGRLKGGRSWWQPYLDNQTWGGAFLGRSVSRHDKRRALSYAWQVLRAPAQGGQLLGLDGQGGPWSMWNEGTGQYAAVGGSGAAWLVEEILAQQRLDGSVPGSPDAFAGGGVWTTRWHGVAPTAWLYLALNGLPFPGPESVQLPAPRRVGRRVRPTS